MNPRIPSIEGTDYYSYGFKSALQSKCNPNVIIDFLQGIYTHLSGQKTNDPNVLNEQIANTQLTLAIDRKKEVELKAQVQSTEQLISQTQADLQSLEVDRSDYENKHISSNNQGVNFTLAVIVVVFLSCFLFLFYASAGYTALFGLADDSNGFLNTNLFQSARENGVEVLGFVILFPTLFFAVGFALHIALDNQKKRINLKTINPVIPIIAITFMADVILGYKISEGLHNNAFNKGHTDTVWEFSMIFTDVTFYLVLIIGFAAYILWGFLLHFILSHPNLKSETIDILYTNTKIQTKREALNNLNQTVQVLKNKLVETTQKITTKVRQLEQLAVGETPLSYSTIKMASDAFVNGFKAQIIYTTPDLSNQMKLSETVDRLHANWLAEKHLLNSNYIPLS